MPDGAAGNTGEPVGQPGADTVSEMADLVEKLAEVAVNELVPAARDEALRVQLETLGAVLANIAHALRLPPPTSPSREEILELMARTGFGDALAAAADATAEQRARLVPIDWRAASSGAP
ncbi:MAG: hypothetical protein CL484_15505 [Acidobacteria bacterium]|nr:hypothetical protein [Acidobacteriota bacterium]